MLGKHVHRYILAFFMLTLDLAFWKLYCLHKSWPNMSLAWSIRSKLRNHCNLGRWLQYIIGAIIIEVTALPNMLMLHRDTIATRKDFVSKRVIQPYCLLFLFLEFGRWLSEELHWLVLWFVFNHPFALVLFDVSHCLFSNEGNAFCYSFPSSVCLCHTFSDCFKNRHVSYLFIWVSYTSERRSFFPPLVQIYPSFFA